jgi:hypothetical protein
MSSETSQPERAFARLSSQKLSDTQRALLRRLRRLTGEDLTAATMATEPRQHWPPEANALLQTYAAISWESHKRSSRAMTRDVSRFLAGMNSPGGLQGDLLREWLARY